MSGWFFDHPDHGRLKRGHYSLITIDPPWPHEHWGKEATANARPYRTMTIPEIKAMPVGELAAKDCLLLLWVVAPQLDIGIECMTAWGFTYRSFMHWRKVYESGLPAMGQGKRVRTMGELCLLGTIGEPRHKPFRGDFPGIRREHSRKPETFYYQIDKCCPGLTNRADVFTCETREGYDAFGDQANKYDRRVA